MKRYQYLFLAGAAAAGFYALWRSRSDGFGSTSVTTTAGPRIVILGAGFGGLSAAKELRRELGPAARVTLIDRHNYHLFTPMLYEVAAWGLDPYDTAFPVRELASRRGLDFRRAMVTGVDFDAKTVQLDDGSLAYDYLIIGLGTTTNFFGVKGAEQYAYPMKWLEDGVAISNQVIDRLERASVEADAEQRRILLTFVIVGGGATGVESAAALQDMLTRQLGRDYAGLDPSEAQVIVVEMADRLLGHMPERMADIAKERLEAMGVQVWFNAQADEVGPDHVKLADGRTIATNTIFWTTGVRAPDVVANMGLTQGKAGSIKVDQYLLAEGRSDVYAIGDNAHFQDPQTHESVPLLAQAAIQEGEHAAANLARQIRREDPVPFHYRPLGEALSLGRWHGEVQLGRLVSDGFIGWAGWRLIHLVRITSARDKLATLLDWGMGYLYDLDTTRLDVRPSMPDATQAMQHA